MGVLKNCINGKIVSSVLQRKECCVFGVFSGIMLVLGLKNKVGKMGIMIFIFSILIKIVKKIVKSGEWEFFMYVN